MKKRKIVRRSDVACRQQRGISFSGLAGGMIYLGLIGRLIQWIMKEGRIRQRRRRYEEEMKSKQDSSSSRDTNADRTPSRANRSRPAVKPIALEQARPSKMADSYDVALEQAQNSQTLKVALAGTSVEARNVAGNVINAGQHTRRNGETASDALASPDESKAYSNDEIRNHDFPEATEGRGADIQPLTTPPAVLPSAEKRRARGNAEATSDVQRKSVPVVDADHITPDLHQEQK